jgi:hypothetical protein
LPSVVLPSLGEVVEAISLACSPVFPALSVANALGGEQTNVWCLVRMYTLSQLIDDAVDRGADLNSVRAACCELPVFDTPPFRGAVGYDGRPRCPLCARVHYVDKRTNEALSCGDTARFRNPPAWTWTRATREEAIEGTYTPQGPRR